MFATSLYIRIGLIDLEIIADVIENDLGPLLAELTNLIGFVERTDK